MADPKAQPFEIISPVFRSGSPIPCQYSCAGQNVNPPLNILSVPKGTVSLALIIHDPDAPGGDYLHWLVWDIPPHTDCIAVNSVPVGAVQGQNSSGKTGYTGPCPPAGSGVHRYRFDCYALDTLLNQPAGSSLSDAKRAMRGHILDRAGIIGTAQAE